MWLILTLDRQTDRCACGTPPETFHMVEHDPNSGLGAGRPGTHRYVCGGHTPCPAHLAVALGAQTLGVPRSVSLCGSGPQAAGLQL